MIGSLTNFLIYIPVLNIIVCQAKPVTPLETMYLYTNFKFRCSKVRVIPFISIEDELYIRNLTLFHVGGGYMPPYHILAIFSGSTYPRRPQLYSKFRFCNCRTPEIGFGSKKFPTTAHERPPKSDG